MDADEGTEQTERETKRRPSISERRRSRRHARAEEARKRPLRRMWPNLTLAALLFFLIAVIVAERPLPLPAFVRAEIENSVNSQLERTALRVGGAAVSLGRSNGPKVSLNDLQIGEPGGGAAAVLNSVTATLVPAALMQGLVRPETVELDGAQVTLRRDTEGRFSFASDIGEGANLPLSDVLATLDDALADPTFASIREVSATGVVLTVEDARTGRIWQATNAQTVLRRTATGLSLSLTSDVFNGTDSVAEVQLSFAFNSDTRDTSLGVRVENMPAADIAQQSPILSWLGVLDAPLSGAVRAEYDGTTGLKSLAGTLDIASGALSPVEGSDPQPFETARAYFQFDPEQRRLNFSEISVQSDSLTIEATGHTYLADDETGWPEAFVGQFRIGEVRVADNGLLEDTVALTDVTADMRLRLDPFTVDIAQLTAPNDGAPVHASAHIEARSDGWSLSADARTDAIAPATVLAFWPLNEAPATRGWLHRNVRAGRLTGVTAAVRKTAREPITYGLTFDVEDGVVKFLPDMPPITDGFGRATLINDRFTLVLDSGVVALPDGGLIDGSGSVLTVPDIEEKPSRGIFDVTAEGTVPDLFTLLDRRPLRLLQRIERGADLATGNARIAATFEMPLIKDLPAEQVTYQVAATIRDARSDTLIEGRSLVSNALRLTVDKDNVVVTGSMELDGVPLSATWRRGLKRDAPSQATGRILLSSETLSAVGVRLPPGMLTGAAQASFALDLADEDIPRLSLTSDLRGAGLRLGGLGWSKPEGTPATFEISANLTETPSVPSLSLAAPGLVLSGSAAFGESGGGALELDTARIGGWLDASARVEIAGGVPRLALTGGTLDLRNLPDFDGIGEDASNIDVALDQLIVTDSLRLGPFRGALSSGPLGLSGDFQGRLNGGVVVRTALAPTPSGTGVRIQANDAGAVLRDARLTPNARRGTLDIAMSPVADAPDGTYNGQFVIENLTLQDAPVLAALLDAASVVGLGNSGILFNTVDGLFRLTPDRLTLRDVAATGISMGISANGTYDLDANRMDIEGVVSPFYFLNAIGNLVSRRGEGLFGMNYRVTGRATGPRVTVNPLSLLTPGAFRQIFRRAPPTE